MICAINCILRLNYCDEHEDFLVYIEKEFMDISRSTHTALSAQLKKCVGKNPPKKKRKVTQEPVEIEQAEEDLVSNEVD